VLIDFAGLRSINSAEIGRLILVQDELSAQGMRLALLNVGQSAAIVLEMMGVSEFLPAYAGVDGWVKAASSGETAGPPPGGEPTPRSTPRPEPAAAPPSPPSPPAPVAEAASGTGADPLEKPASAPKSGSTSRPMRIGILAVAIIASLIGIITALNTGNPAPPTGPALDEHMRDLSDRLSTNGIDKETAQRAVAKLRAAIEETQSRQKDGDQ
jgi:hypothetical protein